MSSSYETISREVTNMSQPEQVKTIGDIILSMPKSQHKSIVEYVGGRFPEPDETTSNKIWLMIIRAYVGVMVGAFLVLGIGIFYPTTEDTAKLQMILMVFTTITTFLAGLLIPSPLSSNKS